MSAPLTEIMKKKEKHNTTRTEKKHKNTMRRTKPQYNEQE